MSLLTFILIGWIDGSYSGGVVNIEFETKESCLVAKSLFEERHDMSLVEDRFNDDSWVECVSK